MKNKIIYLTIFIFSASLFTSAKLVNNKCIKTSRCAELMMKECKESKKTETTKEAEVEIPSLGLFFFTI
jgi:hypothetical protein